MRRSYAVFGGVAVLAVAGALFAWSHHARRQLELSFADGKMTLIAQNVTVPEVLAEWAKRGDCQITNTGKLDDGVVNVQIANATEQVVLDTLLRPKADFLGMPRAAPKPGASVYQRIYVVALTQLVAPAPAGAAGPGSRPTVMGVPIDEHPAVPPMPVPAAGAPPMPRGSMIPMPTGRGVPVPPLPPGPRRGGRGGVR